MWKKEKGKISKRNWELHNDYVRRDWEFQSYSSGTGGGPSLPEVEPYNPDVHG